MEHFGVQLIAFNDILVVTTPLETDSSVTDAP